MNLDNITKLEGQIEPLCKYLLPCGDCDKSGKLCKLYSKEGRQDASELYNFTLPQTNDIDSVLSGLQSLQMEEPPVFIQAKKKEENDTI